MGSVSVNNVKDYELKIILANVRDHIDKYIIRYHHDQSVFSVKLLGVREVAVQPMISEALNRHVSVTILQDYEIPTLQAAISTAEIPSITPNDRVTKRMRILRARRRKREGGFI